MLLIIILGLTAKLALISCVCDCGTRGEKGFDWNKFSGPRPWYFLAHKHEGFEDSIGCPITVFASPGGNTSLISSDVYDIRGQRHMPIQGYGTNWSRDGYFDVNDTVSIWTRRFCVLAVEYDRYVIIELHAFNSTERPLYVGYRSCHPDENTKNEVEEKLLESDVDVSQLKQWSVDHCKVPGSSDEGDSSA